MSVKLKQRTYRDKEGNAVKEGSPDAAFLVGPAGATVTNAQAEALGLVDGMFPEEAEVVAKERAKRQKEADDATQAAALLAANEDGTKEDDSQKGSDNKPGFLARMFGAKEEGTAKTREEEIVDGILAMEAEVVADPAIDIFTNGGAPDAMVLSNRVGFQVSADERTEVWEKMLVAREAEKQGE